MHSNVYVIIQMRIYDKKNLQAMEMQKHVRIKTQNETDAYNKLKL